MNNQKSKKQRLAMGIIFLILIFVIGGIGGVFFDQKVLPFIRTNKFLSKIDFLEKTAENVTIINKTEQVVIKEDDSINEIASQSSNAVANIISISNQKDSITKLPRIIDQSGTGVVVTSDGLIVAYRGAIIEKDAIYRVFLFNGNYYDAKLLGIDEFTDLAYLKIEASNLTAISFGNSSDVRPGKKIVAIANSFGEYQNRYASGLLSNINKTYNLSGKTLASTEKVEGVFETDFSDQKEYIGAPIIGYSGDLLGIIGMQVIDGQNKYFEIPSNIIKDSIKVALTGDFQSRPIFGAYYISITKEYAIAHDLKQDRGAMIFSPSGKQGLAMIAGSAAEKSDLRINDIITMVGNQAVNLDNPLSNLLNQYKKGETVELTVERAGQEIKIQVGL